MSYKVCTLVKKKFETIGDHLLMPQLESISLNLRYRNILLKIEKIEKIEKSERSERSEKIEKGAKA